MPKGVYQRPAPEQRFWDKVSMGKSCWEWVAGKDQDGYGLFRLTGITTKAHRASFFFTTGETPVSVLHSCDNPPCVRPDHLFAGDHLANMKDARKKGRGPYAANLAKTHCPQGHPYSGKNLARTKEGWRQCRACTNASSRMAHQLERAR